MSPSLCGYRKGYSTQTALISLLEKWKYTLDNKNFAGAVLMDLSKAFDTINHQLLIACLCIQQNNGLLNKQYCNILRLTQHLVVGLRLFKEFHRDLCRDHFFSIFI